MLQTDGKTPFTFNKPLQQRDGTVTHVTFMYSNVPVPTGPSIMAVAVSLDAMMAYSGDVVAYIMYDSLKTMCGTLLLPSRTWMYDDCDSAASSLCVEWVANTVGAFSAAID
jgi:hypothetical protein